MNALIWLACAIALPWALAIFRVNRFGWIAGGGIYLLALDLWSGIGGVSMAILWVAYIACSVVTAVPSLRRTLVSDRLLKWFRTVLPQVSRTEQEALDAGTVWWDAELFSGKPSWSKLLATPQPQLTPEEQAFVDGPVDELCRMCDDWEISHELNDLPDGVWRFIKENGFIGMIIPKEFSP